MSSHSKKKGDDEELFSEILSQAGAGSVQHHGNDGNDGNDGNVDKQNDGTPGANISKAPESSNFLQRPGGLSEIDIPGGRKLNWDELPDHACRYCGLSDITSVVKCVNTGKWFCNGRGNTSGSHIVNHLVRSRSKEVALHPEAPLGDTLLECFNCGGRNVFVLGFVPSKEDAVVVLLCREPCLASANFKDQAVTWDVDSWQPLLEGRAFVSWLVKQPSREDSCEARDRCLTSSEIMKLEELWRSNPDATLDDLDGVEEEEIATSKVALVYDDAFQYQNTFAPLVNMEADYDRRMKEAQRKENVSIRWDVSISNKRVAYFFFTRESNEQRIASGDEIRLRLPMFYRDGSEWKAEGLVSKILPTEEVCVELRPIYGSAHGPWDIQTGFAVESVWKATTFDRMQSALRTLALDDKSISSLLYHLLLGKVKEHHSVFRVTLPENCSAPNLADLNSSQRNAVKKALQSPLGLIQGPPGTGKTTTAASVVFHMAQQGQGQVLVCAPSNIAVDQLAARIHKTGLKVVRVAAKSREAVPGPADFLSLHIQMRQMRNPEQKELMKLLTLKEETGELSEKDDRRFRRLRERVEREILETADVICTTCAGAGDQRLKNFRFKMVLIDEATQATEPECLIPCTMGAKQLILVGDHCQLGPVIMSKTAAAAGLSQSLFERLVLLGIRPLRLEVQYRMHPALSEFPSMTFYDGALQNGITHMHRLVQSAHFPWPNLDHPIFFYNSSGMEEISPSGTSYLNRQEAKNVERILTHLLKNNLKPSQIGVVTPYEGQRAYVMQILQRQTVLSPALFEEVEVASVDAFQGREKDFIILTCVRSNQFGGIGFLSDPRRLNVALTRAKYGLIICGNAKVLGKPGVGVGPSNVTGGSSTGSGIFNQTRGQSVWCALLQHLQRYDLIVEGPLNALRPSSVIISDPRRSRTGIPRANTSALPSISQLGDGAASRADHYSQSFDMNYYRGGSDREISQSKDFVRDALRAPETYFGVPDERKRKTRRRRTDESEIASQDPNCLPGFISSQAPDGLSQSQTQVYTGMDGVGTQGEMQGLSATARAAAEAVLGSTSLQSHLRQL